MQIKEITVYEMDKYKIEITQLIKEALIHSFPENQVSEDIFEKNFINAKEYLGEGKAVIFVALEGKNIYGWAWCHPIDRFDSHRLHISFLAVMKGARGKGVGHALMRYIMSYAETMKFEGVDLLVTRSNSKAVKLYEDYGFETERLLMRKMVNKE